MSGVLRGFSAAPPDGAGTASVHGHARTGAGFVPLPSLMVRVDGRRHGAVPQGLLDCLQRQQLPAAQEMFEPVEFLLHLDHLMPQLAQTVSLARERHELYSAPIPFQAHVHLLALRKGDPGILLAAEDDGGRARVLSVRQLGVLAGQRSRLQLARARGEHDRELDRLGRSGHRAAG